jgi:hypothetical protein
MPSVRKLSSDEVLRLRSRASRVDLTPYEADLRDLQPGDWGAIELTDTDKVPTVKRRYTKAAANQGKALSYKRRRRNMIPFEVRSEG